MAMLRKLRRSSKDSEHLGEMPSKRKSLPTPIPETAATEKGKLTFFDLPAEVRNDIYELVAASTALSLPIAKKQQKEAPPIVGLLLASRQCRNEYLPLLYSTAPVTVVIKDFEFRSLMRVVSSLYSTELKALRNNQNLVIQLRTQNCTRENLACLRRWLVVRADSLDRLPWRYEVVDDGPINSMGRVRLMRELGYYIRILMHLHGKLEDTVQWELDAMIVAFEDKVTALQEVISAVDKRSVGSPQDVRGLSGGGLR